jgi:SAM-dependent methyltransferase
MELLAGCGSNRTMKLPMIAKAWTNLVTLDINADHSPDVVHDLSVLPYPFADDTFDEVHLYEVMEHLGQQGDYQAFFAQFAEFWRILKPGGHLIATSPAPDSPWAWGDPGHTRIMGPQCLTYLVQPEYTKQVGVTPMTDYRFCYEADFELLMSTTEACDGTQHVYVLQAVKPSRIERKVQVAA